MASLTANKLCDIKSICYNAGLRCCCIGCCVGSAGSGIIVGKEGKSLLIVSPITTHYIGVGWCYRAVGVTCATNCYNPATYGEPAWFIPRMTDLKFAVRQYQVLQTLSIYPMFNGVVYWSDERFACNGPSGFASGVNTQKLSYGGYCHCYSCYALALRRLYY